MTADTAARRRFVQNVSAFCEANTYDGVDLDWEYPANATDRSNLTLLVHELRQAFTGKALSISLAVPAGDWTGKWFDFSALKGDVDWLGIMTYDFYGSWTSTSGPNSPLYGSWSTNTQGWIDDSYTYYSVTRSVPASKLLIGTPFYGWVFNSSSMYGPSSGASQSAYRSLAPLLAQGWTRYWDNVGKVPYMINAGGTQVISYDDTASLSVKCSYVLSKGIRGTIIWAIGQDYLNGEQPLLAALGTGLGLVSGVPSDRATSAPGSFALLQNYPNPFNPTTTITYVLPGLSHVNLTVHDILGREVSVLVNERKEAGVHEVTFDGSNLASGVYFYRLQAGSFVAVKRSLLLK
jgi:chitinase